MIQFPNFENLTFEQANPWMVGAQAGQKFVQNAMNFPQDLKEKMLANQIAQAQAKYAEPTAKADLEKTQLANKYYATDMESQIGLRGAQEKNLSAQANKISYLLKHPGFMGGDETKSIEALRQMGLIGNNYQAPSQQKYSTEKDISNAVVQQQKNMNIPLEQTTNSDINGLVHALINKPMNDLQYKKTLTDVMQNNLSGKSYNSMPSMEKEYSIAQARAFGYTGEQASKLFNQGYDLASLAETKGYKGNDPSSWPVARGAPTIAMQTRIQRANSTLAALDAVEPIISSAYANYAGRFKNVSPGLIKDMLTDQNQDQQSDAFAAYALYPEIQALRINANGGNIGEGAIQHMADASFSRINSLGLSPNSYVYKKSMEKMQKIIGKMNKAENEAIYKQKNPEEENEDNVDYSKMSDDELQRIAEGM